MYRLLLVAGIGVVIVGGVALGWPRTFGVPPVTISASSPSAATTSTSATSSYSTIPAEMHRYQNQRYHFSLVYPQNLDVKEYAEQGGALTVTFTDPTTNAAFEVYATPYNDQQITQDRFKQDEPSGVFNQPTDIMINGTRATMFFGKNAIMGDTREVWFIRDGILYEVATYKQLDSWFSGIMASWKFI